MQGESIVIVGDLGLESGDCIRLVQHGDQVTCCSEHDSARTGCVKMGVNVARIERLLATVGFARRPLLYGPGRGMHRKVSGVQIEALRFEIVFT